MNPGGGDRGGPRLQAGRRGAAQGIASGGSATGSKVLE